MCRISLPTIPTTIVTSLCHRGSTSPAHDLTMPYRHPEILTESMFCVLGQLASYLPVLYDSTGRLDFPPQHVRRNHPDSLLLQLRIPC
jgi:hypothetical protein